MIRRFGKERAGLYVEAQSDAIKDYTRLCKGISCDYEESDSFVYSLDNGKIIENEIVALNSLGVKAEFASDLEIPIDIAGAVIVKKQAHFNPLKLLFEIAKELPIYEHTKVVELMPGKAITDNGEITCKKTVIATHFPILNKHGLYPVKLYQHRSYVIALKGAQNIKGMYVDEDDKGLSFRSYKELLLLGGGGHRTGKNGGCWQELEAFKDQHYKDAEIVARWATQDCMTLDDLPYIGRYSKSTTDLFVATGFNKWGMTNAMVAANILSDLVRGRENPYTAVFSPSRSILRPRLATNLLESIVGLLTPTVPRCPHLGCALKYNKVEHTWDCPCHGSRFTEQGELIDNPATDDRR